MIKWIFLLITFVFASCSPSSSIPEQTVMITNITSTSGGSGSIVSHSKTLSEILTNAHVCQVVKKGGLVHTLDGVKHLVVNYRISNLHDLCLITVAEDLKVAAHLAPQAPSRFDTAIVSGHPALLPTTITDGHFGDKQIVNVMTGYRDCTDEDRANPNTFIFCTMIGKLPVVKRYEAIFETALIQPGSSGSAVYNQDGFIAAVIFAGAGDIGYGFAVPFEYVEAFLTLEAPKLTPQAPEGTFDPFSDSAKSVSQQYDNVCDKIRDSEPTNKVQEDICNEVENYLRSHGWKKRR